MPARRVRYHGVMADQDDERLTRLEVRLAYQDKLIEELDGVVREFAARVEALERALADVREALPDAAPEGDQRPPHY
jgi:uncharacterized coiled-coil protein SlyX